MRAGKNICRAVCLAATFCVSSAALAQQIPYLYAPGSIPFGGLCGLAGCISPEATVSANSLIAPSVSAMTAAIESNRRAI